MSKGEKKTKPTFVGGNEAVRGKKKARHDARDTLKRGPPKDPSTFFKGGSRVTKKKGLRMGLWGGTGAAKTHCGLSCPKPIYIIDSEFGTFPLLEQPIFKEWLADGNPDLDQDYIYVFEAAVLDEQSAEPDPLLSLEAVEEALTSLVKVPFGTVVIDTVTDVWGWINTWLEGVAIKRTEKTGDKYRFEWGKANSRYRLNMMRLLTKPMNLVLIGQERPIYDSAGKETSSTKGDWQKKTPHWVDLALHCRRGTDGKFRASVDKCRIGDYKTSVISPITYPKVVQWLEKEFPWRKIRPLGYRTVDEIIRHRELQEKVKEDPGNTQHWSELANLLTNMGLEDEAKKALIKVEELTAGA